MAKGKILLAEDDLSLGFVIKDSLQDVGFEVTHCPDGEAIEKAFDCKRCGISVIGLEVPHAHMHLVPINSADDLNFTRQKLNATQDELKAAQEKIKACLMPG